MAITFSFQHPVSFTSRRKISRLVQQLFTKEGKILKHLNIVFCSNEFLLKINRQYLSHDYLTDIITFDLSEGAGVAGEIYISAEMAALNAKEYNVLITNELYRLIIHGSLHLCGYRDKKRSEKAEMTRLEDLYLSKLEDL